MVTVSASDSVHTPDLTGTFTFYWTNSFVGLNSYFQHFPITALRVMQSDNTKLFIQNSQLELLLKRVENILN